MASEAAVDEEDWLAAVVTGTSWRAYGTVGGRLAGISAGDNNYSYYYKRESLNIFTKCSGTFQKLT